LLIVIGALAVSLSLLFYQYSSSTSAQILEIASQDIRSNVENQAHGITRILENKIEIISTHLQVIANTSSVKNGEYERSRVLFDTAENVVGPPADFFAILDQDGRLMWSSNINQTQIDRYLGLDLSSRPYFIQPRDTHQPYFSAAIESVDNVSRIFISVPVVDNEGNFKGITYSGIRLDTTAQLLQNELPEEFQSSVSILDRDGMIMHTADPSFIGKSVISEEIQSKIFPAIIPTEEKDIFNNVMRTSIQGQPGSADVSIRGVKNAIAFAPVTIDDQHFLTIYVIVPHVLAADVGALVAQQNNLSIILIAFIGAVAFGIAFLVLLWNRRLTETVDAKTEDLKKTNESLAQANEQLKVTDKMQREFINIAAHELRTPTQAILGYSDLFYMSPENREESLKAIARNAKRLEGLTNDILDVTKIEGNALNVKKETFNLDKVLSAAVEDSKSQIVNGDIEFVYQGPKDIMVEGDKERITQVISNLLENAVKFTQRGTISIITEEKGNNEVMISVIDRGIGIHPDIKPRLFTKFASKSQTGTGLGLFISKSIVEAHGGEIWAKDNEDGMGATFTFTLPLSRSENKANNKELKQ
jgi:signal transduction histidine kinase